MKNDAQLQEKLKIIDRRLNGIQIFVFIAALLLIIWLVCIQIIDIHNYRPKAERQRNAESFVMRGEIFDRNGEKLASDKQSFNIYAHTADYTHTPEELAQILSPIVKIPIEKLKKKLSQKQKIILVKKDVDRLTALDIKDQHLREISLDKKNERVYPQGRMAAHVLGYYNPDAQITAGVENTANELLSTATNKMSYEKVPSGDVIYDIRTDVESTIFAAKGKSLTLTLHNGIQHVCESELHKMITERKALRGGIIVIQPKTGEILGYAVYPNYDPNNYKNASPLQIKNWTLTDVYPPGSTFKVLTLAAGLESGKINEHTKINDTGRMKIGGWTIENYDASIRPNPGYIDLYYLLEHSSNVASAKAALMIGKQEYYNILKRFGIGSKTGIDLPCESIGLLPHYSGWGESEHASMGFGYGASTTFIQMASIMSAIANKGIKITPHVIKYPEEELPKHVTQTPIMSPETAATMTKLLSGSINKKSPLYLPAYTVAAKTGTSRKPLENGKGYSNKLYTSVMGFLPASDPEVMIYVVIDSAQGGAVWGSTVASPVFREVALQAARILSLKPDRDQTAVKTIE